MHQVTITGVLEREPNRVMFAGTLGQSLVTFHIQGPDATAIADAFDDTQDVAVMIP